MRVANRQIGLKSWLWRGQSEPAAVLRVRGVILCAANHEIEEALACL